MVIKDHGPCDADAGHVLADDEPQETNLEAITNITLSQRVDDERSRLSPLLDAALPGAEQDEHIPHNPLASIMLREQFLLTRKLDKCILDVQLAMHAFQSDMQTCVDRQMELAQSSVPPLVQGVSSVASVGEKEPLNEWLAVLPTCTADSGRRVGFSENIAQPLKCLGDEPQSTSSFLSYEGFSKSQGGSSSRSHVHDSFLTFKGLARTRVTRLVSRVFDPTSVSLRVRLARGLVNFASQCLHCLGTKCVSCPGLEAKVNSNMFKMTVLLVIVANTGCMAIDGSYSISSALDRFDEGLSVDSRTSVPEWLTMADYFFLGFYYTELLLRVAVFQGQFLVGPEWRWNFFDSGVVLGSTLEVIFSSTSPGVWRLLRFLKLSRTVRTLRILRMFPSVYPLQFLVLSCANSLSALFWTCSLVFGLILIFSTILVSAAAGYIDTATAESASHVDQLRDHFSSLPISMLTLFLSFLGEAQYKEVILVLLEVDWFYCIVYLFFVIFVTLAVMNIISGIFITEAMDMASQDREIRQRGTLQRARKNLNELSNLFHEIDKEKTGRILRADFEKQIQNPDVQCLFQFFKLDILDASAFFTLLDVDGNGHVDIEEFVVGCLRMHGKSNAIDMEISIQETKTLANAIARTVQGTASSIRHVTDRLHNVMVSLDVIEQKLHMSHSRPAVMQQSGAGLEAT